MPWQDPLGMAGFAFQSTALTTLFHRTVRSQNFPQQTLWYRVTTSHEVIFTYKGAWAGSRVSLQTLQERISSPCQHMPFLSPLPWSTEALPSTTALSLLIPPNLSLAPGLCCRKGGSQPAKSDRRRFIAHLLLPCSDAGWSMAWLQKGVWDKDTAAYGWQAAMCCSLICKWLLWQYRNIGV